MKKNVFLLIAIVLNILIAQSLNGQARAVTYSVVAGVSKSSIIGESDSWKDPVGGQAGIIVSLSNFSESISFKVEANLSMQGAKWEDIINTVTVSGRTNLLYLNAPLIIRYRFKKGFFAEAGVQPGLLLRAKDKYSGIKEDYMVNMNKFDFSIPFGIGYEFRKNFAAGLRVIPGLSNINAGGTAKDHNFVVALRGIYTFE